VVLSSLLVSACSSKTFETKEEVWNFVKNEENDLIKKKQVNGVDYVLTYKPTDILVAQEMDDEKSSNVLLKNLRDKYDDHLYFDLTMSKNNRELLTNVVGNPQEFGSLVNTLAFGLDKKVHLYTEKKDTISLTNHIYPRMYGMTKKTSVLLVYSRKEIKNAKSLTLVVEDLGFNTGEVKLKIPYKAILKEPKLDFASL
jgi:hypothetical protein